MKLKQQCEEMKLQKKLDLEDIKHMVKMKEEKLNIEYEKKVLAVEKAHDEKLMRIKDQYRDKMEARLEKETANIKSMYADILTRLPNVNVRLKGDV
jgi:competence protein ComGF